MVGKQLDVSWASGGTPGTPTGGLSSTLTLTNDTWYHAFLILVSDTVEVGFDTSVVAANLITDHSATKFRRIGSVRRGTATNLGFSQVGDDFLWDDPPLDINATNPPTTAVTRTLTVPADVKVWAKVNLKINDIGGGAQSGQTYLSSLDVDDEAASASAGPLETIGGTVDTKTQPAVPAMVRTNTSSQIRSRTRNSGASIVVLIATLGWFDRRGRDD